MTTQLTQFVGCSKGSTWKIYNHENVFKKKSKISNLIFYFNKVEKRRTSKIHRKQKKRNNKNKS